MIKLTDSSQNDNNCSNIAFWDVLKGNQYKTEEYYNIIYDFNMFLI